MSTDQPLDEALPEDLKAFEDVLRRLSPNSQTIHRDRLMYLAGRASADRPSALGRVWPISTASLLLVSLVLGALLIGRGANEQPLGQLAKNQPTFTSVAGESGNANVGGDQRMFAHHSEPSYLQLRTAVLSGGSEALPGPQRGAAGADSLKAIPLWPTNTSRFGG